MNEYGCVSFGYYIGAGQTMARRVHLGVSMGIFDPGISGGTYPSGVLVAGGGGISIMGSMQHSIMGG